jgi:hypothetical protein
MGGIAQKQARITMSRRCVICSYLSKLNVFLVEKNWENRELFALNHPRTGQE